MDGTTIVSELNNPEESDTTEQVTGEPSYPDKVSDGVEAASERN